MFERISNSWELVKASVQVLKADKELILFPILSGVALVVVSIAFFVPVLTSGVLDQWNTLSGIVVLFLFYLVQYTIIVFSNSALVAAAMIRLRGGDPTVGDGFRGAFSHLPGIVGWALISATVGMVLGWISDRGWLGAIVSGLVEFAWNVATFLVVPILVVEGVGPLEALSGSASLLKKTWGERIVGNLSIGLIFGLPILLFILLAVGGVALGIRLESRPIAIAIVVIAIIAVLGLALISSTLSGIYCAAVYNYAVTGEPGTYFEKGLVEEAFRQK